MFLWLQEQTYWTGPGTKIFDKVIDEGKFTS